MTAKMASDGGRPQLSVDEFLTGFPESIRELSNRLRAVITGAVPDLQEAVYPGWWLIGYRIPVGKKTRYVGFIAPFEDRVMLGFEAGTLMTDPGGLLQGHHLKQVRYVEVRRPEEIDEEGFRHLVFEAAMITRSRGG